MLSISALASSSSNVTAVISETGSGISSINLAAA